MLGEKLRDAYGKFLQQAINTLFITCSDCKKLSEKLIIKSIHSALNNNTMCAQVKLRCKNSSFADNYRYLSYEYNLTNSDWINDIGSLLAKVEIKSHARINNLDVSTVKELCHMRDNSYYNILSYHDLRRGVHPNN